MQEDARLRNDHALQADLDEGRRGARWCCFTAGLAEMAAVNTTMGNHIRAPVSLACFSNYTQNVPVLRGG